MPRSAKAQGRLQTYVVLLRGINVGGKTKISMSDLRTLLTGLGAEDVRTHLQSGNAVLRSRMAATRLTAAVEKAIARELSLEVSVLVRTRAQLVRVVASNPLDRKSVV